MLTEETPLVEQENIYYDFVREFEKLKMEICCIQWSSKQYTPIIQSRKQNILQILGLPTFVEYIEQYVLTWLCALSESKAYNHTNSSGQAECK